MARDTYLKKILGEEGYSRIRNTKVLLVGAGGIGCELLKDLVLTQFGEIHIVDLDTITLSNLNRQFLFRFKDIDKSKSLTVAESVQAFNYSNCKLIPFHGNIMDTSQFPLEWWQKFDYIYNALDNLEARRFVNKMCLFLKKPLMESGTTGYDGQIQPIFPYYSECFECQPKATPKTFPICTIRSTPSQPVHCITWAKEYLFNQLFDDSELTMANTEFQDQQRKILESESDDKEEIENMLKESNELLELRRLISDLNIEKRDTFMKELTNKIFFVDIQRLLEIESLWKFREKPTPLDIQEYSEELDRLIEEEEKGCSPSLPEDTNVWSTVENLFVLYKSSKELQSRLNNGESFIAFDKDDEATLDFVSAASNLRSLNFNIPFKSKFEIKEIAGNIIPAIATTNAIISGLSCLGSLKYYLLPKDSSFSSACQEVPSAFISIRPNKYLTPAGAIGPNDKCPSCSHARGIFHIGNEKFEQLTLEELITLIKSKYEYQGDISIVSEKSKLIYDCDFDDNLELKLNELRFLTEGSFIIQDDEEKLENLELWLQIGGTSIELPDIKLSPKKNLIHPPEENNGISEGLNEEEEDLFDDELIVELDDGLDSPGEPAFKKRKP